MIFSKQAIKNRQTKLQTAWSPLLSPSDAVIVSCGVPTQKPGGLDQNYDFLPHPSYYWLTGRRRAEGVAVFSLDSGWTVYEPPISRDQKLWEGLSDMGENLPSLKDLATFFKKNSFHRVFLVGSPLPFLDTLNLPFKHDLDLQLLQTMNVVRRAKDSEEVDLIQKVGHMANAGYKVLRQLIRPGLTERQLQIEYEAEVFRAGAHGMPYGTLMGSGPNSAILHAVPSQRVLGENEMLLVDGGAEVFDYCVDVTRQFPTSGHFTPRQKDMVTLVAQAQAQAIQSCTIGREWHDVHLTAAKVIAEGLHTLKIFKSDVTSVLESGAISMFFPHGVGHLVGLRVRDTGQEENTHPKKYCGVRLRVDLQLQENTLITVEPGCYFHSSLINDLELRAQYKDFINWNELEKWKDFGGIRLEDNVLITAKGPQVLTAMIEK